MQISEINPFLRDAEMQLSILEGKSYRAAYDYRIFYVLGGNARILFQGESYVVSGGDLVFFRPGVPYTWAGKCRGIVLNFDLTQNQKDQKQPICPPVLSHFERERIFENDPPDLLAKTVFLKKRQDLEPRFVELVSCYSRKNEVADARASAILKELLCELLEQIQPPDPKELLVSRIIAYIHQNCTGEITNREIAAYVGYNALYCNRVFQRMTGCTIHRYVLHERLRIACRLLRGTALPVEQVAFESGFHDRPHFCTTFKNMTGQTPSAYRRSMVKENREPPFWEKQKEIFGTRE